MPTLVGKTAHYTVSVDPTLTKTGSDLSYMQSIANGFLAVCEGDFALMASWFPGVTIPQPLTLTIQSATATTRHGGSNDGSSNVTITIDLGGPDSTVTFARYCVVAEVTEIFMAAQGNGYWYAGDDEGSKGEALSRFLV